MIEFDGWINICQRRASGTVRGTVPIFPRSTGKIGLNLVTYRYAGSNFGSIRSFSRLCLGWHPGRDSDRQRFYSQVHALAAAKAKAKGWAAGFLGYPERFVQ